MTDSKEDGPSACPFCGAHLQRQQTSSGHWHEHMGEVEDCYATGSIVFDENIAAWNRRASSPPVGGSGEVDIDVDELAGEIRYVDGEHKLGAGALAEALAPYLRLVVRSAPVPNGVPEWGGREAGLREALAQVEAVRVSPQWSGKHADWICGAVRFELEQLLSSTFAASPVTPEGLSGDTARLDWLETMTVNVRTPLLYGSHDLFWANPDDSFEGQIGPSDIRTQIDGAMAKAPAKTA